MPWRNLKFTNLIAIFPVTSHTAGIKMFLFVQWQTFSFFFDKFEIKPGAESLNCAKYSWTFFKGRNFRFSLWTNPSGPPEYQVHLFWLKGQCREMFLLKRLFLSPKQAITAFFWCHCCVRVVNDYAENHFRNVVKINFFRLSYISFIFITNKKIPPLSA